MIKVIGHRGVAGLEPENTLRSFRRAIELRLDYVESDVYLTKDDRLVVIHDRTVDRTTDGHGPVEEMTFEEIRKLNAGKGEKVPALSEVLDLVRGKVKIHVELKGEETPKPVFKLVQSMDMIGDVVLTSGDTDRLKEVRALSDDVTVEHIFGDPPPDAIERALSVGADRVSAHIKHITRDYVASAHQNGLLVIAWPPNTEEEIARAMEHQVDMICSDRPDIVMRMLGRAS